MGIGMLEHRDFVLRLQRAMNCNWFIETGTWKGETTNWASEHFLHVATVEADANRYAKTREYLKKHANITMHLGDSYDVLPNIMPDKGDPAILWLDAHKFKHDELPGIIDCPLLKELDAIRPYDAVLIDDARMFLDPPGKPQNAAYWPNYDQVRAKLAGRYIVIHNDAIIAVPMQYKSIVKEYLAGELELGATCLTSNGYIPIIPAFVHYWQKFSDGLRCKIVRYDVRPPSLPKPQFSQFAVGAQEDYTFSQGLRKYLYHHPLDLVLIVLDDYFLTEQIDRRRLDAAIKLMQERLEISKIDLSGDLAKYATGKPYLDTYICAERNDPWRASLQAALWRKDALLSMIEPSETPWAFEKKGSKRLQGLVLTTARPIINYVNAVGGEGNFPGVIAWKRIPETMHNDIRRLVIS